MITTQRKMILGNVLIILLLVNLGGCGSIRLSHNTEVLSRTKKGVPKQELIAQLLPSKSTYVTVGEVNDFVIERYDYLVGGFIIDKWPLNHVFFHNDKYIGSGHRNGLLAQYIKDILPLDNNRPLLFMFRAPTKTNWISGFPEGCDEIVQVYANDQFVGQLDHVGGLLWDQENEGDVKLTITQDGEIVNTASLKVKSGEVYKLEYLYPSGVLGMVGDKKSLIKVTSTPPGAAVLKGPDDISLEDTGFKTPHNYKRMTTAFKWIPECYQLRLNNQESDIICKDNTFGDREVHFDFDTDLQEKPLDIVTVTSPVEYVSDDDKAEEKLARLKKMFNKGLISEDEYKQDKTEVLKAF